MSQQQILTDISGIEFRIKYIDYIVQFSFQIKMYSLVCNKMISKKVPLGTIPKSYRKKVTEGDKIDSPNTQIHDMVQLTFLAGYRYLKLSWLKQFYGPKSSPTSAIIRSCTCSPHMSKISHLNSNRNINIIIQFSLQI